LFNDMDGEQATPSVVSTHNRRRRSQRSSQARGCPAVQRGSRWLPGAQSAADVSIRDRSQITSVPQSTR